LGTSIPRSSSPANKRRLAPRLREICCKPAIGEYSLRFAAAPLRPSAASPAPAASAKIDKALLVLSSQADALRAGQREFELKGRKLVDEDEWSELVAIKELVDVLNLEIESLKRRERRHADERRELQERIDAMARSVVGAEVA
jgi:hypothetical protein